MQTANERDVSELEKEFGEVLGWIPDEFLHYCRPVAAVCQCGHCQAPVPVAVEYTSQLVRSGGRCRYGQACFSCGKFVEIKIEAGPTADTFKVVANPWPKPKFNPLDVRRRLRSRLFPSLTTAWRP